MLGGDPQSGWIVHVLNFNAASVPAVSEPEAATTTTPPLVNYSYRCDGVSTRRKGRAALAPANQLSYDSCQRF